MSFEQLQTIIDQSLLNASPLTRELFESKHMTATELQRFVNEAMSASIATVSAAGYPHASLTLIAYSNEGELYFAANDASVLFRNLQQSANVALTVDAKEHGMIAQGRAELAGRASDLRGGLLAELDSLMERGRWLPPTGRALSTASRSRGSSLSSRRVAGSPGAERVCEVAYDHMQGDRFRHAAQFVGWRPGKRRRTAATTSWR